MLHLHNSRVGRDYILLACHVPLLCHSVLSLTVLQALEFFELLTMVFIKVICTIINAMEKGHRYMGKSKLFK